MLANPRPLILALLLAITAVAPAAAAGLDRPEGSVPAACLAQASPGPASGQAPVPPIFYTVPDDLLAGGENPVRVEVRVDGERYIEERFTIHPEAIERTRARFEGRARWSGDPETAPADPAAEHDASVFELLAERPEMRARVHELAGSGHRVEVEVEVAGRSAVHRTLDELSEAGSDVLGAAGPPVAIDAVAQAFAIDADAQEPPSSFYICGDGDCGGGTPPTGETCETCPQDCGGPCSICGNGFCGGTETCSTCAADCGACDPCPRSLGTEERTDWLGSTPISTQCKEAWPGIYYYTYTRNDYKRYTVQLTEQCDGSITETVVPGSTTYFSAYCWKFTGVTCGFTVGSAFPVCF